MLEDSNTVLVVDDEPAVAREHAEILGSLGYRTLIQTDPERVEKQLRDDPDIVLVFLDILMPRLNGIDLLERIKLTSPQVGVVMVTVVNTIEHAVKAIKGGAYNYLLKPPQPDRVKEVVDSYFANQPSRISDDPRFSGFITCCPKLRKVFWAIKSFAEADITVLIQGETGTGKELVAQIMHALSPRADRRFLAVNVAAIAPSLFESELFGHRRGAFTGAHIDHSGYFQAVGDGTLFLDEIGDLERGQQKKLLRVVQTRRYCPVGETTERELRARLVLATNQDLLKEVKTNEFRADLFYRLAGHTITLPPLRERTGDVEILANYLLQKYRSQFGRTLQGFHPDAMRILNGYSFPGNIRELDGIISSAVLLETQPLVTPASLPRHVQAIQQELPQDLRSLRRRAITNALEESDGNQTLAAKKLGMSRSHLNRLLNRLFKEGQDCDGDVGE